jgi:cyclopropane fatty-acyl-phospholipid synthase-like methyltransferase
VLRRPKSDNSDTTSHAPKPKPKPSYAKAPAPGTPPKGPLPPGPMRMGGKHFKNDDALIATAVRDVRRLQKYAGLTTDSRVLDWGCGAGRLAIGIRESIGRVQDYHGIDVQQNLVDWCQENLAAPGFRFTHVDVTNERYNPDGSPAHTLETGPQTVDVFYAYSVFSHMNPEDTGAYLRLIAEALSPEGRAFVTCFVEEGVEDWVENPEGYGPLEWKGRLHCTRFARPAFEALVAAAGLSVDRFEYGRETDGQSLYVLRHRPAPARVEAADA